MSTRETTQTTEEAQVVQCYYTGEEIPLNEAQELPQRRNEFVNSSNCIHTYDGDTFHEDDVEMYFYCELSSEYFSDPHNYQHVTMCGTTAHIDSLSENDSFVCLDAGRHEGEWVQRDYAWYCEEEELYYHEDDERPESYPADERLNAYHRSPYPENLNRDGAISNYSIGFEIEKTEFVIDGKDINEQGQHVGKYALFSGFEMDSSCGVEAITNVLPLGGKKSKAREVVHYLMDKAKEVIDSPVNKRCGGHMTISSKLAGHSDAWEILDKLKHNLAIIYAMYRHRLKNSYCNENKQMRKDRNTKYSPINVKHSRIELRLPSAVHNVQQLKNRYDIMFKIMYHTFDRPINFESLLSKVTPELKSMYGTEPEGLAKIENVKEYARLFRYWLINGVEDERIKEYI